MTDLVADGATLKCSQGTSTGSLTVLPGAGVEHDGKPAATVDDYKPMVNIPTFGMCQTQANPQVAAATSAAQGVLTPQPCIPLVTSSWSGGAESTANGVKLLKKSSTCSCQWSGSISVEAAGQSGVEES